MDSLAEYGRQILSLVVVFSLLGFTVWKLSRRRGHVSLAGLGKTLFAKPFGGKGPEDRVLETVERLVLTPQHALHVLRWHNREILVSTHPQGCTLLDSSADNAANRARA